MALNVWPRRTSDLVAPFADGGRFRSSTLKATETRLLPDAAWVACEKDHDAQALAESTRCSFARCLRRRSPDILDASERATRVHRPPSQIF